MLLKPRIYIDNVISYTSEDTKYKVENMKKGISPWMCSKEDKSGRLEGEFELRSMCSIFNIQVGNFNSHTIEILVGRSSKSKKRPTPPKYKTYLPTFTLFPPGSPEKDLQLDFKFTKEHFVKSLFNKMWDRIKIVLTQPTKQTQFGVKIFLMYEKNLPKPNYTDFLNLSLQLEERDKDESDGEEFYAKNEKYYDEFYRTGCFVRPEPTSPICANLSPYAKTLHGGRRDSLCTNTKKGSLQHFRARAKKFLKDKKDSEHYLRFMDFLDDFELESDALLTLKEKHEFYKLYISIVGESRWDDKKRIFDLMAASVEGENNDDFYEDIIPKTSDLKELLKKKQESQRLSNTNKTSPSKTSKKSRPSKRLVKAINTSCSNKAASSSKSPVKKSTPIKLSKKSCFPKKSSIEFSTSCSKKNSRLKSKGTVKPKNLTNKLPDEFIQSDGAVPSTSAGIGISVCPICEERFPVTELIEHAAFCNDDSS